MSVGGARPGAGRPKGSTQKITTKAREEAKASGLLPHEWLLTVSRGEPVIQRSWKNIVNEEGRITGKELVEEIVYADFPTRLDAAKAAAPYYAPRLAAQQVEFADPTHVFPTEIRLVAASTKSTKATKKNASN